MGHPTRAGHPLICAIESARGLLAAHEIASVPGVRHLSLGGVDLPVADRARRIVDLARRLPAATGA